MTTEELKRVIHQQVDSIQNEGTLVDLQAAVALLIEQQDIPMDDNSSLLQERLNKVMSQVEQGDYITNEAMKQQIRQWIGK